MPDYGNEGGRFHDDTNTTSCREVFGITLLELVVVLVIVAVLIAAAVPLYVGATRKSYKPEAEAV
ncbi:MAG TPA: prepilin-type N-terminal cleavage/methylation domain-containing protein [bacterium]|nr:prepilin-type N-terminal cleavage/methylation domain-containing protein [bacterium]